MINLKSINFNLQIAYIFIVIGFIVSFIDAKSAIAGYSLIICALIFLLVITFALLNRVESRNKGIIPLIKFIISHSFPVLLILALVSWILSIYISNFDRLQKGDLPYEFKQFNIVSTILFFFELFVLFSYFQKQFSETKIMQKNPDSVMAQALELISSQSKSLLYLLASLSMVSVGIMQTIVNYYLTDG